VKIKGWGQARPERPRAGAVLGRGQLTPPHPSARGLGALYALPAGSGAEPRPPKRFLAFYRRQTAFLGITVVQTQSE